MKSRSITKLGLERYTTHCILEERKEEPYNALYNAMRLLQDCETRVKLLIEALEVTIDTREVEEAKSVLKRIKSDEWMN